MRLTRSDVAAARPRLQEQ